MTGEPYRMPARDWGDAEPEPVELPTVLVSSRDGAPVPHVPAAARLEAAAVAIGWTARQTYALAAVPATSRKAAHELATVAVRLSRRVDGRRTGWGLAVWHNVDGAGWRFAHAFVNGDMLGARSIVEALR